MTKFILFLSLLGILSSCTAERTPEEPVPPTFAEIEPEISAVIEEMPAEAETSETAASSPVQEEFIYTELTSAQNVDTYVYIEGYEPPVYQAIFEEPVPEFLTEEQQNLYRRAKMLYPILRGRPISIDDFPRKDGIEHTPGYGELYILPIDGEEFRFFPAYGRYENWADFREMGVSVFTEAYFEEISEVFFEIHEHTFYRDVAKGSRWGYVPEISPDTFDLVSQTDTQIEFDVIGHYYTSFHPAEDEIPEEIRYPVRMVLTENGWRFEQFDVAS